MNKNSNVVQVGFTKNIELADELHDLAAQFDFLTGVMTASLNENIADEAGLNALKTHGARLLSHHLVDRLLEISERV